LVQYKKSLTLRNYPGRIRLDTRRLDDNREYQGKVFSVTVNHQLFSATSNPFPATALANRSVKNNCTSGGKDPAKLSAWKA
jgi:hypothetical protein